MKRHASKPSHASRQKGFTLIELLVVIAIIAILSAVILAALQTASLRGRDSAVKTEVGQLRTVMDQEYTDTGSYKNLLPVASPCSGGLSCTDGSWLFTKADCATWGAAAKGTYASQAAAICANIISNSSQSYMGSGGAASLWIGSAGSNYSKYSIMAWLPYENAFYCAGSSDSNSDNTTSGTSWLNPGCYNNP